MPTPRESIPCRAQYSIAEPASLSLNSQPPNGAAPSAAGKSPEVVDPVTYARPDASTAMPLASSDPAPLKYVEYASDAAPVADVFTRVTNASGNRITPTRSVTGPVTARLRGTTWDWRGAMRVTVEPPSVLLRTASAGMSWFWIA